MKPTIINVKYLDIHLYDHFYVEDLEFPDKKYEDVDELLKTYPEFDSSKHIGGKQGFFMRINVDTGQVVNWPKKLGRMSFMNIKIVDSGVYVLLDDKDNVIVVKEEYVPDCLQIEDNGYDDYFEFNVNDKGYVENWKFDKEDYQEFIEI